MTDGMQRRLHMGCGEPLVGIYPLRDKSPAVVRPPVASGKRPERPRQRGRNSA